MVVEPVIGAGDGEGVPAGSVEIHVGVVAGDVEAIGAVGVDLGVGVDRDGVAGARDASDLVPEPGGIDVDDAARAVDRALARLDVGRETDADGVAVPVTLTLAALSSNEMYSSFRVKVAAASATMLLPVPVKVAMAVPSRTVKTSPAWLNVRPASSTMVLPFPVTAVPVEATDNSKVSPLAAIVAPVPETYTVSAPVPLKVRPAAPMTSMKLLCKESSVMAFPVPLTSTVL